MDTKIVNELHNTIKNYFNTQSLPTETANRIAQLINNNELKQIFALKVNVFSAQLSIGSSTMLRIGSSDPQSQEFDQNNASQFKIEIESLDDPMDGTYGIIGCEDIHNNQNIEVFSISNGTIQNWTVVIT